jgi:uncharacterized protein with FMN-binding domain
MKKIVIPVVVVLAVLGIIGTISLTNNTSKSASGDTPVVQGKTYKDGTFQGEPFSNRFGTVQVSAVVTGSKITDITFQQMPDEPGHTSDLSARAKTQLRSEAITSQSSQVDFVSGATDTTEAFQRSLKSALSKA